MVAVSAIASQVRSGVVLAALQLLWALYYAIYAAGALFVTGVWALFEQQPAWVFTFPNNTNDAIFHLVGAAFFAAVAVIQIAQDRAGSLDPDL